VEHTETAVPSPGPGQRAYETVEVELHGARRRFEAESRLYVRRSQDPMDHPTREDLDGIRENAKRLGQAVKVLEVELGQLPPPLSALHDGITKMEGLGDTLFLIDYDLRRLWRVQPGRDDYRWVPLDDMMYATFDAAHGAEVAYKAWLESQDGEHSTQAG